MCRSLAAFLLIDLLGGQVQAVFGAMPSSIEPIRAAKLRALAATTATRIEALPDIPTVSEFRVELWVIRVGSGLVSFRGLRT
jgi:tripartite-type tricarboxylate transporter receptor subunit TctC